MLDYMYSTTKNKPMKRKKDDSFQMSINWQKVTFFIKINPPICECSQIGGFV